MKSSSEKASHLHCFILVLNSRYRKETPCIQSNIPFYIWPLTGWKVGLCWWKHFVRLMMDPKKKSWVFLPPSSKLRGRIVDLPVFHLFQPLKASCEGKYTDITQFCTTTRHKKIIFFASAMQAMRVLVKFHLFGPLSKVQNPLCLMIQIVHVCMAWHPLKLWLEEVRGPGHGRQVPRLTSEVISWEWVVGTWLWPWAPSWVCVNISYGCLI